MYEHGVVMFKFAMRNFNVWHMLHMCMPKSVQCDRKGFHNKRRVFPPTLCAGGWGPMNT